MHQHQLRWVKNPAIRLADYPPATMFLLKWKGRIDVCETNGSSWPDGQLRAEMLSTRKLVKLDNFPTATFALIQQEKRPLRVEPINGEVFCYLVESENTTVPDGHDWREYAHRVEMVGEQIMVGGHIVMNGNCSCPDYDFHKHKQIADGCISRCKHVLMCVPIAYETLIVEWARRNRELLEQDKTPRDDVMRRRFRQLQEQP